MMKCAWAPTFLSLFQPLIYYVCVSNTPQFPDGNVSWFMWCINGRLLLYFRHDMHTPLLCLCCWSFVSSLKGFYKNMLVWYIYLYFQVASHTLWPSDGRIDTSEITLRRMGKSTNTIKQPYTKSGYQKYLVYIACNTRGNNKFPFTSVFRGHVISWM